MIFLAIGMVLGWTVFPEKWNKAAINIQLGSTLVLIFSMGVSLGSRPGFFEELADMGLQSLLFTVCAIAGSIALVYPLSKHFLAGHSSHEEEEEEKKQ